MCENADRIKRFPPHPLQGDDNAFEKVNQYWDEYAAELRQNVLPLDSMLEMFLHEHPKYIFRSIKSCMKDCDRPESVIRESIARLCQKGTVVQNARNEDQFGHIDRVREAYPDPTNVWQFVDCNEAAYESAYKTAYGDLINNPMIDPATFQPVYQVPPTLHAAIVKATQPNMFDAMQDCLREVHKLISKAEALNKEVLTTFS